MKDYKGRSGYGLISYALFIMLIVLASWAALTPNVMADWRHDLNSTQDNGATINKGTITINSTEYSLDSFVYLYDEHEHQITYAPEEGYAFVRWETSGTSEVGDPNSQTTTLTTHDDSGYLTAVYREITSRAVGGYATSIDKFAIMAPYITLIGLIGIMSTIFAIRRWRKD